MVFFLLFSEIKRRGRNDKGNPNNCLVLPEKQNNSYLHYSDTQLYSKLLMTFMLLLIVLLMANLGCLLLIALSFPIPINQLTLYLQDQSTHEIGSTIISQSLVLVLLKTCSNLQSSCFGLKILFLVVSRILVHFHLFDSSSCTLLCHSSNNHN